MQTVAESAAVINFDQALLKAAATAKSAYPFERLAVERGLQIALSDGVVLLTDGTAQVRSQSQPEHWYAVNGKCPCKATIDRCAHRWAKSLSKWAHKLVQQSSPPQPKYFSTYYTPAGAAVPGIAQYTERGWLHVPDDGAEQNYVAIQALCLGGRVDIADQKRAEEDAAGGLAYLVCHQNGMVKR